MLRHLANMVLGATARAGELVADEEQRIVTPRDGGCAARPLRRDRLAAQGPAVRFGQVIPLPLQRLAARR